MCPMPFDARDTPKRQDIFLPVPFMIIFFSDLVIGSELVNSKAVSLKVLTEFYLSLSDIKE